MESDNYINFSWLNEACIIGNNPHLVSVDRHSESVVEICADKVYHHPAAIPCLDDLILISCLKAENRWSRYLIVCICWAAFIVSHCIVRLLHTPIRVDWLAVDTMDTVGLAMYPSFTIDQNRLKAKRIISI